MAYVQRSRDEIIEKLEEWRKQNPLPDDPGVKLGGKGYTPKQILTAVKGGEPKGAAGIVDFLVKQAQEHDEDPIETIQRAIAHNNQIKKHIRG